MNSRSPPAFLFLREFYDSIKLLRKQIKPTLQLETHKRPLPSIQPIYSYRHKSKKKPPQNAHNLTEPLTISESNRTTKLPPTHKQNIEKNTHQIRTQKRPNTSKQHQNFTEHQQNPSTLKYSYQLSSERTILVARILTLYSITHAPSREPKIKNPITQTTRVRPRNNRAIALKQRKNNENLQITTIRRQLLRRNYRDTIENYQTTTERVEHSYGVKRRTQGKPHNKQIAQQDCEAN